MHISGLREARRVLKPDETLWVSGTYHIIFSLGFALQTLNFKIVNDITWQKPDPPPNALHTAFTHQKAVAVRSRERGARFLSSRPVTGTAVIP